MGSPRPSMGDEGLLCERDEAFVNWIMRRAGLTPGDYKPGTLARRLPACLRALRCNDTMTARKQIERHPALAAAAVNALVIGVTSFFRDPPVFRLLQDQVLPDLLDRSGTLRVWSVGCSEGQEVYSLAMVLAELNALFRVRLLGTDCRETAVRRAATGIYNDEEVRSIPADLRDRHFVPQGHAWRALDALRQSIHFRLGDALRFVEPGAFDMICCRNMAIYLHPQAAGRLWQALENALRPGGVLVLGKAETPVGAGRMTVVGSNVYRRTRG